MPRMSGVIVASISMPSSYTTLRIVALFFAVMMLTINIMAVYRSGWSVLNAVFIAVGLVVLLLGGDLAGRTR